MLQAIALGVRGVLATAPQTSFMLDRNVAAASRSALARLRSGYDLALLDDGDESALETEVQRLDLQDLVPLRVWTPRLGLQARPPRPLAFRWLANRWGVRPVQCLYVAGCDPLAEAARLAGWRVVPFHLHPSGMEDLHTLADRLDAGARPWEC